MALLVVIVKLYHPFDNIKRQVYTASDLGTFQIDWDFWRAQHIQYLERETSDGRLGRGNEMKVKEQDVLHMSEQQLDEYLDWYERTWVNEPKRRQQKRDLPQELLDMFPTGRLDGSVPPRSSTDEMTEADQAAIESKLKAVQRSLKPRNVISSEEEEYNIEPIRRIGSFYKRYHKEEDLPPHARTFFEAAASMIGVSFSSMVIAVLQTEQSLLNYRTREVRKEKQGRSNLDSMDDIAQSEDGGEEMIVDDEMDSTSEHASDSDE